MGGVSRIRAQDPAGHAPERSSAPALEEIIDVPAVQALMEDFTALTGLVVALLDVEGRVLIAAGWQDVCTRFHRVHPETLAHCRESDTALTTGVSQGEFRAYTCMNGMTDVVTPLFVGDMHVGNIFSGQFFYDDQEPNPDFFKAQAVRYGFDLDEYLEAVSSAPRFSRARAESLARFVARLTDQIAQVGYSRLLLSNALEDYVRVEASLRESEDRFKYVFEHSITGKSITYVTGELHVNEAFASMLGYPLEVVEERDWREITHPDDIESSEREIDALVTGRADSARFEKRFIHSDGSVVWTDVATSLRRDEDGNPVYFVTSVVDRSASKRADEAMKDALSFSEEVLHASPVGIVVYDESGRCSMANEAAANIIGATLPELLEQNFRELETWRESGLLTAAEAVLTEGDQASGFNGMLSYGPHSYVNMRLSSFLLGGTWHLLCLIDDVTDRKQAEDDLIEVARFNQQIVDSAREGIVVYGPDLRYRAWNPFMETLIGLKAADVLGKAPLEVFPFLQDTGVIESLALAMRGQNPPPIEFYFELNDKSGWLLDASTPLRDAQGEIVGVLATVQDVTDRKLSELKLEAHLEHLEIIVDERTVDLAAMNEELTVINEELQEATDAKSAFLASMSHELRTPLNSIIGFSGVLSQGLAGPLTDVQLNQIGMINKSGRHLLTLIEGILDLAKIEARRMEVDVETVDAGMLVREVADFIRPLAEEKHLALGIQVPEGKFIMNTDVVRLKQILLNLVGNAVKFTSHGEIRIIAEVIEGSGYAFTVTDTGPGIAEADMVRVFEQYTQLEWLDAGKPHGTGLGLHLSQEFAVLLGGHISVESEVGTGSAFTLFLPDLPVQSPEGLR